MHNTLQSPHYRTQWLEDFSHIPNDLANQWDALVRASDAPSPFIRFDFFRTLVDCGCTTPENGWAPHFLLLWETAPQGTEQLVGAMPLYLKSHSYGEYVFDWSWAEAWEQHGHAYYPKLLSAIPFSPIPGPRLLALSPEARHGLVAAALAEAERLQVSSLHILFPDDASRTALSDDEFLVRQGVQFHWQNQGFKCFDDFLASLTQKKRKNIRAERRQVEQAGVTYRQINGASATQADWAYFYTCYANTYLERRSRPYLNLKFFTTLAMHMPEALHLIFAEQNGAPIAAALLVVQPSQEGTLQGGTAYGRYWGATTNLSCLHFETAYYQAIEYCIAHGIHILEGGAQGEHKLARGFLPVTTYSAHWIADTQFRVAVARFLERERAGMSAYQLELAAHAPFRTVAVDNKKASEPS